jgi:hypothetical protein
MKQPDRRAFPKTSAGFAATLMTGRCWSIQPPESKKVSVAFQPYRPDHTVGKVTCVAPNETSKPTARYCLRALQTCTPTRRTRT